MTRAVSDGDLRNFSLRSRLTRDGAKKCIRTSRYAVSVGVTAFGTRPVSLSRQRGADILGSFWSSGRIYVPSTRWSSVLETMSSRLFVSPLPPLFLSFLYFSGLNATFGDALRCYLRPTSKQLESAITIIPIFALRPIRRRVEDENCEFIAINRSGTQS